MLVRVCLVGVGVLWMGLAARGDIAAPDPLPVRFAGADAVVVGTVTEFEKKTVAGTRSAADKQEVQYQVMVVKVKESLLGLKGETHVRVGFVPTGGGGLRRGTLFDPPAAGSTACFFLRKHHKEAFYVARPYWDILVERPQAGFEEQVKSLKAMSKLLEQPEKALESKNADERFQAAALLIIRYRGGPRGDARGPGQEPIDARQSKLLLLALRDADWNKPFTGLQVNAQYLFALLGLTEADGWKPAPFKSQADYVAAARKWLADHADSYRVKRLVR